MLTCPRTNPVRASSWRSASGVPDNLLTNRSTSNGPTRCRSQSRDDVLVKVADRTTSRARSSCRGVAVGAAGRGDTARDGVAAGADARGAGVTEVVADTVGGGALCSAEPPQRTSSGTASRTKPARIIWCSFLPAGLARPAESRPYPGSGCLCALARRDEPLKTLCPASCGCSMATADNLCSGSAPTTTAPSCRPPTTVWTRDRVRGCRSQSRVQPAPPTTTRHRIRRAQQSGSGPLIDGDPNALPGIDRCRRCAGPGERSRLVGSPRVVVAAEPDPLLCIPGDRIGWTVWFIAGTASTTKLDTTRERRVRHLGRGPSRSRSCSVAAPWDVDKGRSGLRTDEHKVAGQRADRY